MNTFENQKKQTNQTNNIENTKIKMDASNNKTATLDGLPTYESGLAKGACFAITLNSYPNGVSVSIHRATDSTAIDKDIETANLYDTYDPFFLRSRDTREIGLPDGKFLIYRDNYKIELETLFSNLNRKGVLEKSVIFFGVNNDPFQAFHKKFAQTAACLDILERYKCARVVIQSRSRMLLTALPTLKALGDKVFCVIPFETRLEKVISRYMPGQPRLEERLITASGLRAQNIKTTFSVAPILPYGETSGDAWKFVDILTKYSDKVLLQSLCRGTRDHELLIMKMAIAQKLEADNQMAFLRPNAEEQVKEIIQKVSPEHLNVAGVETAKEAQLKLFAA